MLTKNRIIGKFANYLFDEYGLNDYAKRDAVFGYAWERGHSSGFAEVELIFFELIPLLDLG